MKNSWELYPKLTEAVEKDHKTHECGHHPFEHALMVAQYALLIAPGDYSGKLAAIAALLHNTDRMFPNMTDVEIELKLQEYLEHTDLEVVEKESIIIAILEHSKKNSDKDNFITVCLKDADKLANISPFDVTARASRGYPHLPLVDPRFILTMDPDSTYRDPKTVFRDAVLSTLEWETWFRLPKAIELARPYFEGLRLMQKLTAQQIFETGLNKYPGA